MSCEQRTVTIHSLVDERFGVLSLVSGDELECFAEDRKTESSWWESEFGKCEAGEEVEEKVERGDEDEKTENKRHERGYGKERLSE